MVIVLILIVVVVSLVSYNTTKNYGMYYRDYCWLWWTVGFPGAIMGLIARSNEKAEIIEQLKKEYQEKQRNIDNRIKQREQRIDYIMNSTVTSQILNCLQSQGTIQEVHISLAEVSAISATGNPCFVFLRHGISDLPYPKYEEWKNQIDEPYLLAEALNRCLGNQFFITTSGSDDTFAWYGVSLKRKELQHF